MVKYTFLEYFHHSFLTIELVKAFNTYIDCNNLLINLIKSQFKF